MFRKSIFFLFLIIFISAINGKKAKAGAGILLKFSEDTKIDLNTAANLMIVISDNFAADLILNKISPNNNNEFTKFLGLRWRRCETYLANFSCFAAIAN